MQHELLRPGFQFRDERRLVIQTRDLEILRCCYEQQFLIHEQIARFFYQSTHMQNARTRIARLRGAGLLRSEVPVGLSGQHLIRVSAAGQRLARSVSIHDVPQAKKVDAATLVHDKIVTDVRLRLRELWDAAWVPEKALKDSYRQIPDGLVQFEAGGSTVAVEIENSPKGRGRFQAILGEWARTEGIRLVLYVATTSKLAAAIEAALASAPPRPAFAVVEYDALMRGTPQARSPRGALDLFSRRTF